MTRTKIPVCLSAAFLCLFLSSTRASAQSWAWFWAELGNGAYGSGDQIPVGTTLYGDSFCRTGIYCNIGTISDPALAQALPSGVEDVWIGPNGGYFEWSAGLAGFSALGPINQSEFFTSGSALASPSPHITAPIGVTRSISDPVLRSDSETRTVEVTVDIPAGSLGAYNQLEVSLFSDWSLPEGMGYTVGAPTFPAGFRAQPHDDVSFICDGATTAVADLSGQYIFSADITFDRSGPIDQAGYGNMYFKPAPRVWYGVESVMTPITGPGAMHTLGGAYSAMASSSDAVNWTGHKITDMQELMLDTVAVPENAPLSVTEIYLIKEKRNTLSGDTVYALDCEIDGTNIVAGTLSTPNGQVYDLAVDPQYEETEFWYLAGSEAGLTGMDFVNGDYVITVEDHNGNQTQFTVPLAGDYPAAMPQWDHLDQTPLWTTDPRQMLVWLPPGADVDTVIFEIWDNNDFDEEMELIRGDDDLDTQTSWTPSQDLDGNGYFVWLAFINEQFGTSNGADYSSGYMVADDNNMNIVPEPATMGLLVLALAPLACRRKRR